jgi:hypothetical protein
MILAGAAAVEVVAFVQGGPRPSHAILAVPFASIGVTSVLWYDLLWEQQRQRRKLVALLAPVVFGAGFLWRGPSATPGLAVLAGMTMLGPLGIASFVWSAYHARDPYTRGDHIDHLAAALIVPVAASMVAFGLWSTYGVNPVYDARIFSFEDILGLRFSLIGMRSYALLSPLSGVATFCYFTVAVGVVVTAIQQQRVTNRIDTLWSSVIVGAIGVVLYFVCPVVGPLQAFASYPAALPATVSGWPLIIASEGVPRNGMPSLHAAWALLIWFNAAGLERGVRHGLRAFAALMLWATMGLEDTHWLMDLVVSVPLTVGVHRVVGAMHDKQQRTARYLDAAVCAIIVAAWMIGFRTGVLQIFTSFMAWAAVTVTVAWPLVRLRIPAALDGNARMRLSQENGIPTEGLFKSKSV